MLIRGDTGSLADQSQYVAERGNVVPSRSRTQLTATRASMIWMVRLRTDPSETRRRCRSQP